jgi:hypothetical protein
MASMVTDQNILPDDWSRRKNAQQEILPGICPD